MSDATIRPYQPSDLEACRTLWRELTQRHRDIYDDQTIGGEDPGLYFDTSYLVRTDLAAVWVVERDGMVVGLTGLLLSDGEGEVEPVVVSEACRSQGIGRQLLEHVIAEARARDVRYLSIRPVARNVEAIELFHNAGFRTLGHIDMFMELQDERPRKRGVSIHGLEFQY